MKEEIEIQTIDVGSKTTDKKCPDFDDECKDVPNHLACFMGDLRCVKLGVAKGYCPFIHKEN